ncbi:DNA/RNA helicase domain-containing protein [Sulfurimonas sp.]
MKHINIISLTQAFDSLEEEEYKDLLVYHSIEIKDAEVNDLKSLIAILNDREGIKNIFNQFYVGYKIPQISKEFDLLRFGEDYIINVELKNSSTEDKILKQLKQNRYYLSFLDIEVHNFTFVENLKKLYHLNGDVLEEVSFTDLANILYEQKISNFNDIDKLFNPSDYLVSPFNSTECFIEKKYFLTHQQELVKGKILDALKDTTKANFFAVTGGAGTGKTLLTYDIAKEVIDDRKKVLIVHCGYLNNGHIKLNTMNNWVIVPIKHYSSYNFSDYDLIVIDEAQRMYSTQIDDIVVKNLAINGNCIFSYDKLQTLATWENSKNIEEKINNISSIAQYQLSEKIRTNKDVASFIKMLFDKKRNKLELSKDNIEISYFNNDDDAREFLEILSRQNWEVLRFTPSQYDNERHKKSASAIFQASHGIIGQEFDNVGVIIDQCFSYTEDGKLHYQCKSYYHPVKMLFQNITRTRKKVHLVIINNPEILNRCLSILTK